MKTNVPKTKKADSASPLPAMKTPNHTQTQLGYAQIQRAIANPTRANLTPTVFTQIQRMYGNHTASRLMAELKRTSSLTPPTNPVQREIGTFQATQDKVMYYSSYGRVYNQTTGQDNPLFETAEEATLYDEQMKTRWEKYHQLQSGISTDKEKLISKSVEDKQTPPFGKMTEPTTDDRSAQSAKGSGKETPTKTPIREGLIHGTYDRATNSVDLHVDNKGESEGLSILNMLSVTQHLYRLMGERSLEQGAPKGKFVLHPTGAAIVKIVIQTLGEALGNPQGVKAAHELIAKRKLWEKVQFWKTKSMSPDKLDPSVIAEHMAYIRSLVNIHGVEITPILSASITGATTPEEFLQNMLDNSVAGATRLQQYEETLKAQEVGVSLDISLTEDQLPAIIVLLTKYASK